MSWLDDIERKHGPNYSGAMASARLQWDHDLSPTMRRGLGDAVRPHLTPARRLHHELRRPTCDALCSRGLVDDADWLTPMGLLVREAGLLKKASKQ